MGIWLYNPDEFLTRVIEVELDLVGRRPDRFIAGELELFDEVFVGVLRHTTSFVGVKEDVVNVERSGYKRLVVGGGYLLRLTGGASKGSNGPEAFINGGNVDVDLDFVVLEGNKRKSKSGVGAEPELNRNVKGGFRKSITRSAYLTRSTRVARTINIRERRISYESELGGVTDHLVVARLLFLGHGELIPDVHPVTVLAVDALTTDFNFNLTDELLTREIKPASVYIASGVSHVLVNFRKSYLKIGSVSKVTISRDGTGYSATEIGLTVESLFNGFHRVICVTSVGNLPESNLRVTRKVNVLCAVSN